MVISLTFLFVCLFMCGYYCIERIFILKFTILQTLEVVSMIAWRHTAVLRLDNSQQ